MRYEYVFYERDVSFDYGDFPGACCTGIEKNGFSVEIDKYDNVNISSLEGFGDFQFIERDIKTPEDLIKFIDEHTADIEETNNTSLSDNKELFDELVEFLKNERVEK